MKSQSNFIYSTSDVANKSVSINQRLVFLYSVLRKTTINMVLNVIL